MSFEKHVICLSTTRPSTSLSPTGGGGTITVMDPMTGACLSSLRVAADMSGKTALGIASESSFPTSFVSSTDNARNTRTFIAYGTNRAKKDDTYAMLLSVRSGSSPPILHWKSRLPEADMSGGLSVSPCGYYIVGGGASGNCFIWSSIGGTLLRTFKAHYRSITCLSWSDCGRYLVTGGGDGMVHLFLLMELVDRSTRSSKRGITPLHTWSFHHFPVTCLTPMESGRMASSAEDGHIVIMELFSKSTVTTIKLEEGITCLTFYDNRLFAGTMGGGIYSIDLDAYAMLETEKRGATLSQTERKKREEFLTVQEKIFGKVKEEEGISTSSTRLFLSDWIGHDRSVSSIAFLVEGQEERLISGDERGEVRIWDTKSRTCLKVLHPWSNTTGGATAGADKDETSNNKERNSNIHPISSILIIGQSNDGTTKGSGELFGSSSTTASHSTKRHGGLATLVTPLQRFPEEQSTSTSTSSSTMVPIPFLKSNRSRESIQFWEAKTMTRNKRRKTISDDDVSNPPNESTMSVDAESTKQKTALLDEAKERIAQLEKQLATKIEEVNRWEKVNNKLVEKLKVKR